MKNVPPLGESTRLRFQQFDLKKIGQSPEEGARHQLRDLSPRFASKVKGPQPIFIKC